MKPGAWTVIARVVVLVMLPEVPVRMRLYCPGVAVLLAVRLSALVPVVGFVAKEAVTPLGRADVTARLTLPMNPYCGVSKTVVVTAAP